MVPLAVRDDGRVEDVYPDVSQVVLRIRRSITPHHASTDCAALEPCISCVGAFACCCPGGP